MSMMDDETYERIKEQSGRDAIREVAQTVLILQMILIEKGIVSMEEWRTYQARSTHVIDQLSSEFQERLAKENPIWAMLRKMNAGD